MGENPVRVSSAAIRVDNGTTGVYKTHETGGVPFETDVYEGSNLPGRSDIYCSFNGGVLTTERLCPEILSGARPSGECGEVPTLAINKSKIFRPYCKQPINDSQSTGRKSSEHPIDVQSHIEEPRDKSRGISKYSGEDVSYIRECGSSSTFLQITSVGSDSVSTERPDISESNKIVNSQYAGTGVVDTESPPVQWKENVSTIPSVDYINGCINSRLGGPLHFGSDRRQMDPKGSISSHQLSRTFGGLPGPSVFCKRNEGLSHHGPSGQHHSIGVHQTQGRDTHRQFVQVGGSNLEVVSGQEDSSLGISCSRERQCHCGLPFKSFPRQGRVEAKSIPAQEVVQESEVLSNYRSVCFQNELPSVTLCSMEAGSRSGDGERILNKLDERTRVCVSALLSIGESFTQGDARESHSVDHSPNLDNPVMVPNVAKTSNWKSSSISTMGRSDNSTSFRSTTPTNSISALGGLDCLRRYYEAKGFSEDLIEVMLSSCRQSTHKQYQSAWKTWCGWCSERLLDPVSAPLKEIMEFLVQCEKKGLSFRTLGVYRSAIALYHEPMEGTSIGKTVPMNRLMKGFFNRNPPKPKYTCTWEVEPVLRYLRQLPPWESLSLKMLTLKVVLLLALVTAKRVSSLVRIDIENLVVSTNLVKFVPSSLLKQSRPGCVLKNIQIEAFKDKSICPVKAVSMYLRETKNIRGSETQLLISHLKPHGKVTSSTVSRWIVDMLSMAGVDTAMFRAHSTRGAATSASHRLGVSMRDIQECAGWKSDSTFSKFYHKPTANSVVARTLLEAASKSQS